MICCLRPQTAFCVAANQSYDTFEKMDINTIFGLSTIEIMRESIKINYRVERGAIYYGKYIKICSYS